MEIPLPTLRSYHSFMLMLPVITLLLLVHKHPWRSTGEQSAKIIFFTNSRKFSPLKVSHYAVIVRGSVTQVHLRLETEYKTLLPYWDCYCQTVILEVQVTWEPHTVVSCSICCTVHTESGVRLQEWDSSISDRLDSRVDYRPALSLRHGSSKRSGWSVDFGHTTFNSLMYIWHCRLDSIQTCTFIATH